MTALERYQRLEATGIWRPTPDEPGRDVLVQFGKATLVIGTSDDAPLTHWSIPAIEVMDRREDAVIYALDSNATETLTIEDRDMRAALDEILATKSGRSDDRPRGSARIIRALVLVALLAGAFAILPGLLAQVAHRMISPERAAQLGSSMIPMIENRTGPRCMYAPGNRALLRLAAQVAPDAPPHLHVLDLGDIPVQALPGGHILLNRTLVERAAAPEEIGGWVALAIARAENNPPLRALFGDGGMDVFGFLANGSVSNATLDRAVTGMLNAAGRDASLPHARISEILRAAGIAPGAFYRALDAMGLAPTIAIADPTDTRPLLNDAAWVALQEICSG